jgi:hypothetical protein
MTERRVLRIAWMLAGAGALACALDLEAIGAGKACVADGRCAEGFVCSAEGRCVIPGPRGDSGSVAGQGGTSNAEDAGVLGSGGSAPQLDAGKERSDPTDGAVRDQACGEPVAYFADDDRDGFGRADSVHFGCAPPSSAWATVGGDCDDANAEVFPGQMDYFGVPYASRKADSFDYDCSGSEDPDPASAPRAPDCTALGALDCRGSGFASTGRTGNGVNPICGSRQRVECASALLGCAATMSDTMPVRCR